MVSLLFLSLFFALLSASFLYIRGEQFRARSAEMESKLLMALGQVEEAQERQALDHADLARENEALRQRLEGIADLEAEKVKVQAELHAARFAGQQAQTAILAGKERGETELAQIHAQINQKRTDLAVLEEQGIFQSFAFYTPRYDFAASQQFEDELSRIRAEQREMIKARAAATSSLERAVKEFKVEGKRQIDHTTKLLIRAFNSECDAAIARVKFDNLDVMEARIKKAFTTLNALSSTHKIALTEPYLDLKLQELHLVHDYAEFLAAQEEEQARLCVEMRETELVRRERESQLQKAKLEEKQCAEALARARVEAELAPAAVAPGLRQQAMELERRLKDATRARERAAAQADETRAGYVYVVSNTGAFGENVYKIGTTHRLDPQEWIRELGDAAVPFPFDIHAIIYSNDAPNLEAALHQTFASRAVNRVNPRRGFFRVTLPEIVAAVKARHGEFEFAHQPEAKEYRQTLSMEAPRIETPPPHGSDQKAPISKA